MIFLRIGVFSGWIGSNMYIIAQIISICKFHHKTVLTLSAGMSSFLYMSEAIVDCDFGEAANLRLGGPPGRILAVCGQASNRIPAMFRSPGLPEPALGSHIAWDLGASGVACGLSDRFSAPPVRGRVSRLIYACNRPPKAPSAIPVKSEDTEIPGHRNCSDRERESRVARVYRPFHACADERFANRTPPILTITSV
ncbi:MAG: N-formylglutamate amidohydrolase [Rhodospirillales bacterium]|nr:N-formylglutamate amidohydrolase [Rhodospirillales bacterium]